MLRENEGPDALVDAGPLLQHVHIAEKDRRTPPGEAGDDFRPYLRALRRAGYTGDISFECRWDDLPAQLPAALKALREQLATFDGPDSVFPSRGGEGCCLADPRGGGGTGRERSLRSDHQKPGGATRSQASGKYLKRTPFFGYFVPGGRGARGDSRAKPERGIR
jgi:hypothetical protein